MSLEHGRRTNGPVPTRRRDRVLTWPQVAELVPYTRQHVGRLEARDAFPKRLQIGPGRVGWWESEVLAWLDERGRGALRPWQAGEQCRTHAAPGATDAAAL